MPAKKRKSQTPAVVEPTAAATTGNGNGAAAAAAKDQKAGGGEASWAIAGAPCHIEIPALDVARIAKFFTDVFGWKCTPWKRGYTMWKSNEKGLGGGFYHTTEPIVREDAGKMPAFALYVNDVPATLQAIHAAGGSVIRCNTMITPEIGAWAEFQDTEGNRHSVFSSRTDNVVDVGEDIHQRVLLNMSAHDAFEVFMDGKACEGLTKMPDCTVERKMNGAFSIAKGEVTGHTISFEQDKKLVQAWHGTRDHPKGHWSTLRVAFEAVDAKSCIVTLKHSGVPKAAHPNVTKGWFHFYWNQMKIAKDLTLKECASGWVYRVGTLPQYTACEKLGKIMPCDEEKEIGRVQLLTANQVKGVCKRWFTGVKDVVVFKCCTEALAKVGKLKWELPSAPDNDLPELSPRFYPADTKPGEPEAEVAVPWAAVVGGCVKIPWDSAKNTHVFPKELE